MNIRRRGKDNFKVSYKECLQRRIHKRSTLPLYLSYGCKTRQREVATQNIRTFWKYWKIFGNIEKLFLNIGHNLEDILKYLENILKYLENILNI